MDDERWNTNDDEVSKSESDDLEEPATDASSDVRDDLGLPLNTTDHADNIPTSNNINKQAAIYLATRHELVRQFKFGNTSMVPELGALLDEVSEAVKRVNHIGILHQEIYNLLMDAEQLYMLDERTGEWMSLLIYCNSSIVQNKKRFSAQKAAQTQELYDTMQMIIFKRTGVNHVIQHKIKSANNLLKIAIGYALDVASSKRTKITNEWLKVYAVYLEANLNELSLETIESECRILLTIAERQQPRALEVIGQLYLVLAYAYWQCGHSSKAAAYAQMGLIIGEATHDSTLMRLSMACLIEYAIAKEQYTLLQSYITSWIYYRNVELQKGYLPQFHLEAHFYTTMGAYLYTKNKFQEAYECYAEAQHIFEMQSDARNIGVSKHGQALAAAKMNKFTEANKLYREASKHYRQVGNAMREIQVMYARVRAWESNKAFSRAYRGYVVIQERLFELPDNEYRQKMLKSIEVDLNKLRSNL